VAVFAEPVGGFGLCAGVRGGEGDGAGVGAFPHALGVKPEAVLRIFAGFLQEVAGNPQGVVFAGGQVVNTGGDAFGDRGLDGGFQFLQGGFDGGAGDLDFNFGGFHGGLGKEFGLGEG